MIFFLLSFGRLHSWMMNLGIFDVQQTMPPDFELWLQQIEFNQRELEILRKTTSAGIS